MMLGPSWARIALLKEQRLDDHNNTDLAESAFFSNVDLIGTGRDEQIANVARQISQNFPPENTWNFQGFEDLLEMLERDTFQNPGMRNSYSGFPIQESTIDSRLSPPPEQPLIY
jgi:hypothetical protein